MSTDLVTALEAQLSDFKADKTRLQQNLAAVTKEKNASVKKARAERDNYKDQLDQVKSQLGDANARVRLLEQNRELQRSDNVLSDHERETFETYKRENSHLVNEYGALGRDLRRCQEEMEKLRGQVHQAQVRATEATESELEARREESAARQSESVKADRLVDVAKENMRLGLEKEALEKEMKELGQR